MSITDYTLLNRQLEALLDTRDWLTNSAQTCAFIQQELSELNWVGFYLQREAQVLCLGPFRASLPATPSRLAKGYVAQQHASKPPKESTMCTPLLIISPVMQTRTLNWWFLS